MCGWPQFFSRKEAVMYRVAIFIDGGYLDKVLQEEFGGVQIGYAALSDAIAHKIHPAADILRYLLLSLSSL
jgi:hypothetical protein